MRTGITSIIGTFKDLERLEELKGKQVFLKKENNFEFDNKFLEDIFKRLEGLFSNNGIEITEIKHFPYQERYFLKKEDRITIMNIIYNKNYRVTNIQLEDGLLLQDINEVIKDLKWDTQK